MSVLIGHASISENGTINGKKGDQTGKEVCVRNFYSKPWDFMAIHPDANVREKHAKAVEAGCANNNIGYGQGDRNTLNTEANNKYYTYTANSKNNSTSTSGSSGLKQTQKPESALCFDKTLAGAYVVTADKLHMRAGAGKTKADYGTIAEGGKVHCYGYYNKEKGTGAKWLYVACGNVTGYCHSDYLKRA